MNFAQEQRKPTKHLMGIGFVILLHVLLVYGLANGLHQKVVAVITEPLKVETIEEVAPPPPPETPPPPPPKFDAPPPPTFIPPPEVSVQPPPVAQNNAPQIASTNVAPPTFAPPAAPAQTVSAAPAAPPAPPTVTGLCSNVAPISEQMSDKWSKVADEEQITSYKARIEVVLGSAGEVKDVRIINPVPNSPGVRKLITAALRRLSCRGQGVDVTATYMADFNLKD